MAQHPLVGMWRLVSMTRIDTEGRHSEAEVLTGLLVYTPEGWMTEALDYMMPGSDLARTHVSYAGEFRIEGQSVIHMPRIHTNPELVGMQLPRQFEVSSDRFILTAPNPTGSAVLRWERVPLEVRPPSA